jgi:hypothetical protein
MMRRRLAAMESFDEVRRSAETAIKMVFTQELGEDATGMEVVG